MAARASRAGRLRAPRAPRETALVPVPSPPQQQIVRIGGRLVDVTGWPPAVVEEIKREYLLPPATSRLFVVRVTLTAVCTQRHKTQHAVGIMADTAEMVRGLADGIPRARMRTNCPECGRQATITGKHVYWTGPMAEWDGAV